MRWILLLFLGIYGNLSAQDDEWLPMDRGLITAGGSPVEFIFANPLDSQIYVGGRFLFDGWYNPMSHITRWNRSLNLWEPDLYPNYRFTPLSMDLFEDDIYIGSSVSYNNESLGHGIFKLVGDNWEHLENGPNDWSRKIKVIDENLYMVGLFDDVGGIPSNSSIAWYDGDDFGSIHEELSPYNDGSQYLHDIEKYQGELYIAGRGILGGDMDNLASGVVKISPSDSLLPIHDEFMGSFFQLWIYGLETYQDNLYICGVFHQGIGFTGNGIQYFDGENMHELGGGVNLPIHDMKVYKNELYVVGSFNRISNDETVDWLYWQQDLESDTCHGVAKWNGSTWTCLNKNENFIGGIRRLEIFDDTLYVGGNFAHFNGDSTMSMIARRRIYPDTTLSLIKEERSFDFSVYPNPSQGEVNINFREPLQEKGDLKLYNYLGQITYEAHLEKGVESYHFSVPSSKGLYIVQIRLGEGILSKRMEFVE